MSTIRTSGFDLMVSSSFSFDFGNTVAPVEMFKKNKKTQEKGVGGHAIDAHAWLPHAAPHYHISPKLEDYVVVPVPAFISDIPNTNGEAAPLRELIAFDPDLGMQAYKTFKGKPTHIEHDNQDITRAKGVIFDTYLKRITEFGNGNFYKVVMLLGFDRTKDETLAMEILRKLRTTYSVGYSYKMWRCSICAKEVHHKQPVPCNHTARGKGTYRLDDMHSRLVYRTCHGIRGFECSSVYNPAYSVALSDLVIPAWDV